MPKYTAVLFPNPDGTHTARIPVLSGCQAHGRTRGEALKLLKEEATTLLARLTEEGTEIPRETWSPTRTIRVKDPRKETIIPYTVAIEYEVNEGSYRAALVRFPDLMETHVEIEGAVTKVRLRLNEHLASLVHKGQGIPLEDDYPVYVLTIAASH